MPLETGAIANHLLDLADASGDPVSPMKLQKILYYAHGWHLALTSQPLLDEQVEAWQWGPVIPSVYHEFKQFGDSPIRVSRYCKTQMFLIGGKRKIKVYAPALVDTEPTRIARPIIDRVWDVYKPFSAIQLSTMTHQPGSPWDQTWKASNGRRGTDIPDEVIRNHFEQLRARKSG